MASASLYTAVFRIDRIILGFIFCLFFNISVQALDNGLTRTPSMGYNPYNTFHQDFNETIIKEMTDKLISTGLAEAGYVYMALDNGWFDGNASQVNYDKFPSGMKHLADCVYERGLKFGLYSRWESFGYETRDAGQWAEWGVDYIKYDAWKTYSTETEIWTTMRDAILATGRPMVYGVHFQYRNRVIGDPCVRDMTGGYTPAMAFSSMQKRDMAGTRKQGRLKTTEKPFSWEILFGASDFSAAGLYRWWLSR